APSVLLVELAGDDLLLDSGGVTCRRLPASVHVQAMKLLVAFVEDRHVLTPLRAESQRDNDGGSCGPRQDPRAPFRTFTPERFRHGPPTCRKTSMCPARARCRQNIVAPAPGVGASQRPCPPGTIDVCHRCGRTSG